MTLTGGPGGPGSRGSTDGHVLVDVFRSVLAHAGLKGEASERLLDQVMEQRRAAPDGDCTLRFSAHAGELEITLSQAGRDWHTTCPVPIR
jgi:hypothetical protein